MLRVFSQENMTIVMPSEQTFGHQTPQAQPQPNSKTKLVTRDLRLTLKSLKPPPPQPTHPPHDFSARTGKWQRFMEKSAVDGY